MTGTKKCLEVVPSIDLPLALKGAKPLEELEELKAPRNAEAHPAGIHPPKRPMEGGFSLEAFAPSLGAEAGVSLGTFLEEFEGE